MVDQDRKNLIILETDHNAFNQEEVKAIKAALQEAQGEDDSAAAGADSAAAEEEDEDQEPPEEAERRIGPPIPGEAGKWASCIRIFDPRSGETTCEIELPDNKAAVSAEIVKFRDRSV